MATLTQPKVVQTEPEFTPAEQALIDAFEELLETVTPEKRKVIRADLRENARRMSAVM
jgi:16S rRNA A1518/A1519 N6-dimethyltransferase RsmA/KsgA/DIM1 with predicted DNA glycosylase/AP lyase activity